MTDAPTGGALNRRDLLRMIGLTAGAGAMYQAMDTLGHAAQSPYSGPPDLQGAPAGSSVLILGAGIAGMTAAHELKQAGYRVQVLEYNSRAGGRNWSVRGGDTYTELGGFTQHCEFDPGLYINPGPWRLPHHHRGMLELCKRLGVKLEPFNQANFNAYVHSPKAYGGKPQRFRAVKYDYQGHVAELLAKATRTSALDSTLSKEDQERLLESLRDWGALDKDFRYVSSAQTSTYRGWNKKPGGGLSGHPVASPVAGVSDVLKSRMWSALTDNEEYDWQPSLFQPVGGMGRIGEAFGRSLGTTIQYRCKVIDIHQDDKGVTVTYEDLANGGTRRTASAQWCLVTIPLSILSQIPLNVGAKLSAAINAIPYASSVKAGLQFKRRFWEQDDQIFGGITYTDLPISNISYPSTDYFSPGKGVLLGAYMWGQDAMEFTSMAPDERLRQIVEQGAQVHPQYRSEFENGFTMAWHRSPFTLGCMGEWSEALRAQHYDNLCAIDGRIALAGEHASFLGGWQEGALTSALDAIGRIHQRVLAQGAAK